jgi:tetratricopeptide (TPR) repeat protein
VEANLRRLIEIAPQSALGYARMGQLSAAQNRWREAETFYRQALTQEPGSLEAFQGLVDLDMRRNQPAEAVRKLKSQIAHSPDTALLFFLLGQAQLKNKQPAEAEQALTRAAQLDKENQNALILLADVQTSRGEVDQALISYQRAIELAPSNVRLYVAKGSLLEMKGNTEQAQLLYQKALSIQPEDALAANNLAYLMLEHGGNVNVALTLAQTARRGLPNMPNSADTLGWAYYHNSAFSVAAPLLEEAVKKVPLNATYRYHLGMIYQKLNDSKRGRTELEKAISIDPNSRIAGTARQALRDTPRT